VKRLDEYQEENMEMFKGRRLLGGYIGYFLEISMDGFCVVGLDGSILKVNSSFCEMTGYSSKELFSMKIGDIDCAETQQEHAEHLNAIIKHGGDRFETKHRRKDGTVLDVEVSVQYCHEGEEKFFFSFVRDITDRKNAELENYKSQEQLKAVFESTSDCILVWDREYNYLYANQAAIDHVGTTRDQVIGKNISDGLGHIPDFMNLWKNRIDKVFATGKSMQVEDTSVVAGVHVCSESILSPIRYKNGEMFAIGVVYRDVSEQRRLALKYKQYQEKLLEAQGHVYVGTMGAIVAHEVNQPLTKINFLLDRSIDRLEEASCSPKIVKDVKAGLIQAKQAALIIRRLRQFSKNSALEGVERINIAVIAKNVVSALSEKAMYANFEIAMSGFEHLPEIEINEIAVEQIFHIIAKNAIDAADSSNPHKLKIMAEFANGVVQLKFVDNCGGIAPRNLDRIFDPFFSTKTDENGLGLGLDIVKQILISCGGKISVDSEVGEGTTFYVTLPVNQSLGAEYNG
jgi:two-component system, cell cycle sensor histidine kinase and response regulator CckA